jgi:hypothetical protein
MFTRRSDIECTKETASKSARGRRGVFVTGFAIVGTAVFVTPRVVPCLSRSFYHSRMERKAGEDVRSLEFQLAGLEAIVRETGVSTTHGQDPMGRPEREDAMRREEIGHLKVLIKYYEELGAYHSHWSIVNRTAAIHFWKRPPVESAPPPEPVIRATYTY